MLINIAICDLHYITTLLHYIPFTRDSQHFVRHIYEGTSVQGYNKSESNRIIPHTAKLNSIVYSPIPNSKLKTQKSKRKNPDLKNSIDTDGPARKPRNFSRTTRATSASIARTTANTPPSSGDWRKKRQPHESLPSRLQLRSACVTRFV